VQQAKAEAETRGALYVEDPDEQWGNQRYSRRIYGNPDIKTAQKAGNLAVSASISGVMYFRTGPLPKPEVQKKSPGEAAAKAAKATRRVFVGELAAGSFTAAELADLLVGLMTEATHPDSRALQMAHRWLTGNPDNDAKYDWRRTLPAASKADQQRAAWALGWASRELALDYSSYEARVRYLEDLQARGYTLSETETGMLADYRTKSAQAVKTGDDDE